MGNIHEKVLASYGGSIRRLIRAGGATMLSKKAIGKGLIGLALPAAALLIEDLSNPDGVVLPFLRWLVSRHGGVRIVEMSAKPARAGREEKNVRNET